MATLWPSLWPLFNTNKFWMIHMWLFKMTQVIDGYRYGYRQSVTSESL